MPPAMPMQSPATVAPARWWIVFTALCAVLLVPLFLTEIPPLLDYPNHLARMEILAHGAGDPNLSRMYRANWLIVPNIGIDLMMPMLMRLMPLAAAGKIFIALALLLPLAGVAALHRAIFRVRSYWPLAAGLVVYNRLFFAGFLNFLIGLGLALLAAALWEIQRDRKAWVRLACATVAAVVIFFCHLIAVGFYGLLLLALELGRARELRRLNVARLALLAAPFLIPAVLYLNAPIGDPPAADGGFLEAIRHYYWALAASPRSLRFYGLAGPFLTYNRLLDAEAMLLVAVVMALAAAKRWLRVSPAIAWLFALLLLSYPLVPFFMMATAWVNQRLPIMAGFLLFAAALPVIRARRTAWLIFVALGAMIVARTAEVGAAWRSHDAMLADFRQVIAPVQPGDRVLVVQTENNDDPAAMVNNPDSARAMRDNDSTMHLPALLVIERRAFWPLLFSAPTKQPVLVLPPYDAISLPEGELPWVGGLAHPDGEALKWAPYLTGWDQKFDWVLVLHPYEAPHGYDLLPEKLELARPGEVATLYKIKS